MPAVKETVHTGELHGHQRALPPLGAGGGEIGHPEGYRLIGGGIADGARLALVYLDGDGAGKLGTLSAPAGEAHGEGAGIAVAGHKADPIQIGRGGAVVIAGGRDLGAGLGGCIVVIVQGASCRIRQVEAHIAQTVAGGQAAVVVKVGILEGDHIAAGYLIAEGIGGADHINFHRAGEAVTIGAPTGKGDRDHAGGRAGGHKGDVIQSGGRGTIVVAAVGHLAVVATGCGVLIVEGALRGGREGKADIAQTAAGQIHAQIVKVIGVKGGLPALEGGIAQSAAALGGDSDPHFPIKAVAVDVPSGKGDGDSTRKVLLGHKGHVVQVGGGRAVIVPALTDRGGVIAGGSKVVVEGTLGGVGQSKADPVQVVAGQGAAEAVEVAVVKRDPTALCGFVGEVTGGSGTGDFDGNSAPEGGAVHVPAGIGNGHLTGGPRRREEIDIPQVGRTGILVLSAGRHLSAGILLGEVIIVEGSPALVRQGEGDITQVAAGLVPAGPSKVGGVKLDGVAVGGCVGNALGGGHGHLDGALEELGP